MKVFAVITQFTLTVSILLGAIYCLLHQMPTAGGWLVFGTLLSMVLTASLSAGGFSVLFD
jgi:hypothetical protein